MLALRKTRTGFGLEVVETAEPQPPGLGEVVVRVESAGICGSDVHAYEWTNGYGFMQRHLPVTVGHEFAGTIAAAGRDAGWEEGARVAVLPGVSCGVCSACLRGDLRGCDRKGTIGLTRDGGFAHFVCIPGMNCIALPDNIDTEIGALVEPLAVACEAVAVAEVGMGDTVLVLGPGTIGQGIAMMARAAGAGRIFVAGRSDAPRLDVLRRLGFAEVFDVAEAPLREQVLSATSGRPVDVVLEATGDPASVTEGLSVLRKDGIIVTAGIHPAPVTFALTDFVRARQQLRASHGATRSTWDRVLALLARDPESFRPMITHRLPLTRGIEGFEIARQRAASKVMLRP